MKRSKYKTHDVILPPSELKSECFFLTAKQLCSGSKKPQCESEDAQVRDISETNCGTCGARVKKNDKN